MSEVPPFARAAPQGGTLEGRVGAPHPTSPATPPPLPRRPRNASPSSSMSPTACGPIFLTSRTACVLLCPARSSSRPRTQWGSWRTGAREPTTRSARTPNTTAPTSISPSSIRLRQSTTSRSQGSTRSTSKAPARRTWSTRCAWAHTRWACTSARTSTASASFSSPTAPHRPTSTMSSSRSSPRRCARFVT
jgi:hypothetical protein